MIATLQNRAPITLFADYFTSSIDVRAFSRELVDLIDCKVTGLLNLASREVSSKRNFVEALAGHLALPVEKVKIGSVADAAAFPRNESCGLDVARAETLLGHHLPNLEQVVHNLVEEYLESRRSVHALCH